MTDLCCDDTQNATMDLCHDLAHEYSPYHTMPAFWQGVHDYRYGGSHPWADDGGIVGQAYDRGMACWIRAQRAIAMIIGHRAKVD
jgi:hypothetical protein